MTPTKATAIALTLIVACPIILGYALASESHEEESEVTENAGSLSELILNSTTEYYIDNTSPTNNASLRYSVSAQGEMETSIVSPDYVSITTTATSLPEYTDGTGQYNIGTFTSQTYTFPNDGRPFGISLNDSTMPTTEAVSGHGIMIVTISPNGSESSITYSVTLDSRSFLLNSASVSKLTFFQNGDSSWSVTINNNTYTISSFRITSDQNPRIVLQYRDFTDLSVTYPNYTIQVSQLANGVVRLQTSTGYQYIPFSGITSITNGNSIVTIGSNTYYNVTALAMVTDLGNSIYNYTYSGVLTGNYAQPEKGWKIPTNPSPYYAEWLNGQINSYIRMNVSLPNGESVAITPIKTDGSDGTYVEMTSDGGVVTVNGQTLGKYKYLMIEIESSLITVTGITAWSSMTSTPVRYASVTIDQDNSLDIIRVELQSNFNGAENVTYRVDQTRIVGGTFPSTKDYSLDLYALYPNDDRQSVIIDSVGVFGDALTIGGRIYTVTDGKIYYSGQEVASIRALQIDIVRADGNYTFIVGGESFTTSIPTIVFDGEWSLTLHRGITNTITTNVTEWVPGEFALDKEGFVLAMLLTAVGAFVVLGMTGGRSGGKVGLLALVCGGAVLVGLMII